MSHDKIKQAIQIECDRQRVGADRVLTLTSTYYTLMSVRDNKYVYLGDYMLRCLARSIEPESQGFFRTTPVSFDGIVGGAHPDTIERAIDAWTVFFDDFLGAYRQGFSWANVEMADRLIKEFLLIHPFIDGNGRTAWLLRVWLLDQWDDPQPLPDYFGGNS